MPNAKKTRAHAYTHTRAHIHPRTHTQTQDGCPVCLVLMDQHARPGRFRGTPEAEVSAASLSQTNGLEEEKEEEESGERRCMGEVSGEACVRAFEGDREAPPV